LLPFRRRLTLFALGPEFLTVSKAITTLGVMPLYPMPAAAPPSAEAPAALFCRTNASPSPPVPPVFGPIWKVK
jgi:hypothetical protein